MPARVSLARRRRAFDEGRRAAADERPSNPYDNVTLKLLWDRGYQQQKAGALNSPIPTLAKGANRAVSPGSPGNTKPKVRPPVRAPSALDRPRSFRRDDPRDGRGGGSTRRYR